MSEDRIAMASAKNNLGVIGFNSKTMSPYSSEKKWNSSFDRAVSKGLMAAVFLAASSAASAGMKPLESDEMGEIIGQAGVSIELDSSVESLSDKYMDHQAGSLPVSMTTGGMVLGSGMTAATGAGFMGFSGAEAYEEIRWDVDFVGASDRSSDMLLQWGAMGGSLGNEFVQEIANVGTHGEVQQSLDVGDMVIHGEESVRGFGSMGGVEFSIDRSSEQSTVFGVSVNSSRSDLKEKIKWGPWDLIFDVDDKSININTYLQAERGTVLDFIGLSATVKVHNSRGKDQYVLGSADGAEVVSFAHFQADISEISDSPNKGGRFTITDFSGDVDYEHVAFGTAPPIGNLYVTDFVIQADMKVYSH